MPKFLNDIHEECFRATYVYICRITGKCADNWSDEDVEKARHMLADMDYDPALLETHALRQQFINYRKGGTAPTVINPAMARKGKLG